MPPELQSQANEDSFQWDCRSQLYYHARSGFYHDPVAGWSYSCNDGRYYRFENGNYVPWESDSRPPTTFNFNAFNAHFHKLGEILANLVTTIPTPTTSTFFLSCTLIYNNSIDASQSTPTQTHVPKPAPFSAPPDATLPPKPTPSPEQFASPPAPTPSPKQSQLGSINPQAAILTNKTSIPVLYPFVLLAGHVSLENRCSKLNDVDPNAIGRREWRPPWLPPCRYVETAPNALVRLEWRPPWTCSPSLRTRTFF